MPVRMCNIEQGSMNSSMVVTEYSISSGKLLREMWNEGSRAYLADIELRVGKKGPSVLAHKCILGTRIPFFQKAFESGMREVRNGVLQFDDQEISSQSLGAVIRAVYGHVIPITPENVFDMHAAASFLQIEDLQVTCTGFMVENLNVESVVPTWHYAQTAFSGSDALSEACRHFMLSNFLKIYGRADFLNLEQALLVDLISRQELGVGSENDVVDAVMTWVNFKWAERFACVEELAKSVHWDSVSCDCQNLASVKALHDRLPDASEAERVVINSIAVKFLGLPKRAAECSRSKPFAHATTAQTLYTFSGTDTRSCTLMAIDWERQLFSQLGNLSGEIPRKSENLFSFSFQQCTYLVVREMRGFLSTSTSLVLYQLGGSDIVAKTNLMIPEGLERDICSCTVSYDPKACQLLVVVPPMASKLDRLKRHLNMRTGDCQKYAEAKFVVYNLRALQSRGGNKRDPLSLQPQHCVLSVMHAHGGDTRDSLYAIADEKIWVMGGRANGAPIYDVVCYSISEEKWLLSSSLLNHCDRATAKVVVPCSGGQIVVINCDGTVHALHLSTGRWQKVEHRYRIGIESDNYRRDLVSAFTVHEELYVTGYPVDDYDHGRRFTARAEQISISAEGPDWDGRLWSLVPMLEGVRVNMAVFIE